MELAPLVTCRGIILPIFGLVVLNLQKHTRLVDVAFVGMFESVYHYKFDHPTSFLDRASGLDTKRLQGNMDALV